MTATTAEGGRRAVVIYASRFGTTATVARAFEHGLKEAGLDTTCESTAEATPESLQRYDLICVGGPTEILSATKAVKEFLGETRKVDLGGKFGFAFDTKYDSRISGSAAKYIEHALDDQGLHMIAGRESAIVTSKKEGGKTVGAILRDGEEKRFEELGIHVGQAARVALAKVPGRP
jgi:flavodoxin